MKKLISIFMICSLLLCLECSVQAASLQGRFNVFDEYGDLQMWYEKSITVARCIDKESEEVIQLDRTYFYPDESIIFDLDDETKSVIFSNMNNEFVAAIELKNNDENNPYPEVEPFSVRISNSGMFESPERDEYFGKDYRVYYLENNTLKEIEITNDNLSGLSFEAEKLGIYIIYFNPHVHNVKFYFDETLEEEYFEIQDLKYHSTFDFPEIPTKEGFVFTGWKHFHWVNKYNAYVSFDRAVVPHALNICASWCPADEYTPLEVTVESEKTIKKGKEDGCEITLKLSEGKFSDNVGWYRSKWKVVGNDELSISTVERIDDTTVKLTLSGNSSDKYTSSEIQIEFDSSLYLSHGKLNDNSEIHEIADIQLDENGIKKAMFVSDNSITLEKQKRSNSGSGIEKHTISFETNGGEELQSARIANGHTLEEPKTILKEGYVFAGWYTDAELTNAYNFDDRITESFTLYAAWEKPEFKEPYNKQIVFPIKIIEEAIELMNSITS